VRNGAYFYKKWLRGVCGLRARIIKRAKKGIKGIIINEPNEGKENINSERNGNTGGNKDGGIKEKVKKNISKEINKGLLF